jgi:protein-tyrosine phosphatase
VSSWFQSYGYGSVLDGLLIGAYPLDGDDVGELAKLGIGRILNLVEDGEYRPGEREAVVQAVAAAGVEEHRLALTDYSGLPSDQLDAAVQMVSGWLDDGARVYVHCRAGWQRSAAVAAGVIALRVGIDIDEALARVQACRPSADPLPHQRADLRRWWEQREAGAQAGGADRS